MKIISTFKKVICLSIRRRNLPTHRSGQAVVEFALAVPILLMLIFGIVEFGRFMQAWLALENGARFAVRYAITGSYNIAYCAAAGGALGLASDDAADGNVDCVVYTGGRTDDAKTEALQDWARLPSIRDAALSGATGIAWDAAPEVSGDYQAYLTDAVASSDLSQDYRGNPSRLGYFGISICSNRVLPVTGNGYRFNPNALYYQPYDATKREDYRFPVYCEQVKPDGSVVHYVDDAGGPGDRVRILLTYRHNLITPFLNSIWPSLKVSSEREGIVEKFRNSRVTGLSGAIAVASTWTFTPLPVTSTFTPTPTPTFTHTSTFTITPTFTTTPTNTKTYTPTITPTPRCDLVTFGSGEQLYISSKRLFIYMSNNSPDYEVTLTGSNGSWLRTWHTSGGETRPANALKEYGWDSGGYSAFYALPTKTYASLSSPVVNWTHNPFGTTKVISRGSNGYFSPYFTNSFAVQSFTAFNPTDYFNYYHGSDFSITVRYKVGSLTCSQTVTGLNGPVIAPTVVNSGGVFSVNANASAGRGVKRVYFNVFNSGGTMVHYQSESAAPYCIFGDNGSTCSTKKVFTDKWSTNTTITNGTYTISIIAVDNGDGNYSTRYTFPLTLNANTPTASNTPLPTKPPTNTPVPPTNTPKTPVTPSNTPKTQTNTVKPPTNTPTNTSNVPTVTPSNTPVRTRTFTTVPSVTPTRCLTPIEMGGCQ